MKFPADFERCKREGGRVRTIAVKGQPDKYMHVCYDKNGKSHAGEVHTKKASEILLKTIIPKIKLSKSFKEDSTEIEVMHAGKWEHPNYGTIEIRDEDIDKFVNSFKTNVRKVDLAVDQEHMPEKGAAGWFKRLQKVYEDGKAKLKATVEWTQLGKQLISDGIFKYFSPEFDFDYEDLETHEHFENVLIGGALTNRPYFKSLAPVALSENMYAGFISKLSLKGGEKGMAMTKEELKAKLAEDSEYELPEDASDEEKEAYKEAKDELAKEAEDKEKGGDAGDDGAGDDNDDNDEGDEGDEGDDNVKASEKYISKAEHTKKLNEVKTKMGVIEKKLRFKEVKEEVQGYVFSESNPDGVLLPKNSKKAVDLLMASTPKVAKLFAEFLEGLPKVSAKLFREEGTDGGDDKEGAEKIEAEATKLVEDGKAKTYGEAVKILASQKPDLFKKE